MLQIAKFIEYTRVSGGGSRSSWREPFVLICVQGFGEPAESNKQPTDGLTPLLLFVGKEVIQKLNKTIEQ